MGSASSPRAAAHHHVILFPFMSKGHTIPILDLAHLLLRRSDTAVTIFTTTGNQSFIATSLRGTSASIITLPFRHEIPDIPQNTESTDQLPSMSHFPAFAVATRLMQPHFEAELEKMIPAVSFMVSDGFLWWTGESAERFGVRRYSFYGMGNFARAMFKAAAEECGLFSEPPQKEDDEAVAVPSFPWIKLRRSDVNAALGPVDTLHFDFCIKAHQSTIKSLDEANQTKKRIMGSASSPPAAALNHIILFPFMSKGHTIPILDLAHLLLRRSDTAVTIFTTTGNQSFIATSLSGTSASIITLPFRHEIPDIPQNTESTDQLPSMSHFPAFAVATRFMQPHFEAEIEKMIPAVSFMVSDGFLWWTGESAERFGVRRYSFYGMGNFARAMFKAAAEECGLFAQKEEGTGDEDEAVTVPSFPWIKLRRSDVNAAPRPEDTLHFDFCIKAHESTMKSHGLLANSFEELEQPFLDYLNRDPKPMTLCVGPLCLARAPESEPSWGLEKPYWAHWLDQKLEQGSPVLYVAFGSQADISPRQLKEIAVGIEKSGVHFLWVLKLKDADLGDGFEKRVHGRGLVVKGWVNQRWILMHPTVQGFLSHCGWNSVMESICSGVPMLGWPMMAEQPMNAKLVAEELRIGLRVGGATTNGGDFVCSEVIERNVRELMEDGEERKVMKEKVDELAQMAKRAVAEGGSSWSTLNSILMDAHK